MKLLTTFFFLFAVNSHASNIIAINQFVSHPALDKVHNGIKDALSERNILPKKYKLISANAHGSISNSVQISNHHASYIPRFMVAISTPSAQSNMKVRHKDTLLAFAAVTDPVIANLISEHTIGVTDLPPIKKLIDFAQSIMNIDTIGTIYNSGEVNSVKIVNNLENILKERGISLKKVAITSSNDIKLAIAKILDTDLIYLPQDNTVISAIKTIINTTNGKVPLISNDPLLEGIMIGIGVDYYSTGMQLGNMIADILQGKDLKKNIQNANNEKITLNSELAKEFGITLKLLK